MINIESKQSSRGTSEVPLLVGKTAAIHKLSPTNRSGGFILEQ